MQKKTRNILSGILVGVASIFAIINFSDIPAEEIRNFVLSTLIFFTSIVLLAFVAVSSFKLLVWIRNKILGKNRDEPGNYPSGENDRE